MREGNGAAAGAAGGRDVGSIALSVSAISFVTLLAEISLTKITSYVLFYPFTYFLIGLALLGLGFGAAWVALKEDWQWTPARASHCLVGFSVCIAVAAYALSALPFDLKNIFADFSNTAVWVALVIALVAPFAATGVLLSTAFRSGAMRPGPLYAADLLSAALASFLAIPLLVALGPVRSLAVASAVAIAAALYLAPSRSRVAAVGGLALALQGYLWVNHLGAFAPAAGKGLRDLWAENKADYSAWHPLFRIDVTFEWKSMYVLLWQRDVWHDGNLGTSFIGAASDELKDRAWRGTIKHVPYVVGDDHPKVLIIGAAGGVDLAVAKHFGAREVTGVELHPLTTELIYGLYADFTGDLVFEPGIAYVNAEGRRFVELTDEKYDLVQLVSPDSYSAQPGASQVLVENYLYTGEAFRSYWNALSPTGILALEIGDNIGTGVDQNMLRSISQARALLDEVNGVDDPERHLLAVLESHSFFRVSNVLISRRPFTEQTIAKLREAIGKDDIWIVWNPVMPDRLNAPGLLASGGALSDLSKYDLEEYDFRPVYDDRPFFFTYFKWLPLLRGELDWGGAAREYAMGQYLILFLLLISGSAVLAALLLPLAFRSRTVPLARAWPVGIAVAIIGWAFLAVEVNTIQRLTLYLGYPTYSLTAVLSGILLGAGVGSAWTGRAEPRRALIVGTVLVIAMAVGTGFVLPTILSATFALGLPLRAVVAVTWAVVQGFGLGVFFPTALRILHDWGGKWVAWGWTVNGTASVFGSALAVFVAMLVGFRYGALLAAGGYLVAAMLLARNRHELA